MNTRGFIATACAAALSATVALLPATGHAYDGHRSGTAVTVGYRDYDHGGRHGDYRDHHRHSHRYHGHPPYGRAHGYYAPRYYYRPYYPSYYYPAPRYYYGPDSGWSVDLHYFFRD